MKRLLALTLCIVTLFTLALPAAATSAAGETVVYYEETQLENGLTLIDQITEYASSARATDKTARRTKTVKDDGTVIAVIAFEATFRYDGTSVSVVSKSVVQTDTYESWSFKQSSFTSSSGTVTLAGKLTKWLVFNNSFTMTMSCDKDGNISGT